MTNYHQSQIANLKSQIAQLQAEKEQLRVLLHELLEAFYKSVSPKKTSTTWTFNPDLEQLFKNELILSEKRVKFSLKETTIIPWLVVKRGSK